MPSGRWALKRAIAKYILHSGTAKQIDLRLLMNHTYQKDLGLFIDGLDTILLNVQEHPGDDLLY